MSTQSLQVMNSESAVATLVQSRAGKYLTFFLAGEEYGLEILKVSEIIGLQPITRVPRMPEFVRGVINLRGKVIPITDLRMKFGMDAEDSEDSCIIVVQMRGIQTGIVVDRVSEVVAIAEADIEDAPSFGAGIRTEFLLGIGKTGGRVKLLLDIDKVLATNEIAALQAAQAHAD
ncbi:chemotaxis protein CheW [Gemmatimonas sp.]|jgi:purine-binding chemotaxis protein CheW|uniref:chemotaxis protein CheW n=1 Tax=Gemmatimonas sp. TaxID=1962908 RepID=UPI0031C9EE0A|nr:chemotaxis protein CheW [Gemmatimonas sp.]